MKKLLYSIFLMYVSSISFAEEGKKASKSEGEEDFTTILVLSLDNEDILSNYYMAEDIAKGNQTSVDSLASLYSKIIVTRLNDSPKSNFRYVTIDEQNIDKNDFNQLFIKTGADYILYLEKYEVNWKGEPFYTLFNTIDYNVYNRNSDSIVSGQSFFDTPELKPMAELNKKTQRMADRIALQATKAIK